MVLIQHLFGIASLRQTYREILVNVAYDEVTRKFNEVKFVTMDAGYKTPWIAKKTIEDGRVPVLPYTRYTGRQDRYKPWEYTYDPANDTYTCPRGGILRHTTTRRTGMESGPTEARRSSAGTARARRNAVQMRRDRKSTRRISGRSIWI